TGRPGAHCHHSLTGPGVSAKTIKFGRQREHRLRRDEGVTSPTVGSRRLNNALLTDWATKVAPTTLSMRQLNGGDTLA
ncbi:MAG: hypothetical protein Q7T40_11255, partial [Methylobacter sp.]|nr:hypothetical protein [Methylobacter sp.]